MIQAMGGNPPIYRPPQSPMPVFNPGGGQGNHSRMMQFLAGHPLDRQQLARLGNGQAPGGFNGAFAGVNPAVLMQLAHLIQQGGGGQLQGGNPPIFNPGPHPGPPMHHPGPGEGGVLQGGNPPIYHPGGGINPAGNPTNGLPFRTVGGGLSHPRPRPGDGGGIVPPRLRRLAGMKPPFSYPVR